LSGCAKGKDAASPQSNQKVGQASPAFPKIKGAQIPPGAKPKVWKNIQKIVMVVLENTDYEDAVTQPFLKQLAAKGALLNNYSAVTHPSQPNYIAMIAGDTLGVTDDENVTLNGSHLGDLMEAGKKTWKSYAEGFPEKCFLGANSGRYYRKHVPFLSFASVQKNPTQCAKIVNGNKFIPDVETHSLPNFSFYTPDIYNDGHDSGIAYADRWLSDFFQKLTKTPNVLNYTLFIVTFDEGSNNRNNRVATLLMGAGIQEGATSDRAYNHYSLLKTIENIYGLSHLGKQDQSAIAIDDVWIE